MEVLAPAGNFEKLEYALAYGADAVYCGQPQFSLRARENSFFDADSVAKAIAYTHEKGAKFYLASNIIAHNNKIVPFQKSLDNFIELKPDALIMSDPGMIDYVLKNHPQQEVHLSVQANCTNWATAKFWYELGIKRVIMSRELNLREIAEIHEKVPGLEIEVFVHGAICMAYSGRCLLSNYMDHRASNQGACSNACRLNYQLYAKNEPQSENYVPLEGEFYLKPNGDAENNMMLIDEDQYGTYIMNSKDMCAIEHLDKIRDAGVVSIKIEGRTKSVFYLSQAVRSYRAAVDDLLAGKPWNPKHLEEINKLDSRGTIPGFFIPNRDLPQNYETTRVQSDSAYVAAFVREYLPEEKKAVLSVKGTLMSGDAIEIITPGSSKKMVVGDIWDHKGRPAARIASGLENAAIYLDEDPGNHAIILRDLTSKSNQGLAKVNG